MHIAIIGGGPGGYIAALEAAKLGAQTTIIEKAELGGTCLQAGCIPTKAYLHSTDLLELSEHGSIFGIHGMSSSEPAFGDIVERKNQIVKKLTQGIEGMMKRGKIEVLRGIGTLQSENEISVELNDGQNTKVTADVIIIATGSTPVIPSFINYDGKQVVTSTEILSIKELPKSLVIVGGGVIGCELGQFFSRLGTKVSIVEMMPRILPNEDKEVVQVLSRKLKKEGLDIYTGIGIEKVEKNSEGAISYLSDGTILKSEMILVSIGRRPLTEGLWGEDLKIDTDKGKIITDEFMRTSISNIYAIGDIVMSPDLAHVASKEGIIAVKHALGLAKGGATYHAVPRCVYTDPQIGSVGMTEAECIENKLNYKIGKFRFGALGKAIAIDKTDGFVKIIADENRKIIGASIVGEQATELIMVLTLGIELGLTIDQMDQAMYAHPSLGEAIMEALHTF